MKMMPITSVSDKNKEFFFSGKCKFPYLSNDKKKILYAFSKAKNAKNVDYEWCPLEFNTKLKNANVIPVETLIQIIFGIINGNIMNFINLVPINLIITY